MFACFDARSYELHLNACESLASKRLLHYTVIHKLSADSQSRAFCLCLSEWPLNCREVVVKGLNLCCKMLNHQSFQKISHYMVIIWTVMLIP